MKIAIAGSTGLIGKALVDHFGAVTPLLRDTPLEPETFEGVDVVINLVGENIANGRWTPAKKRLITESRVKTTKKLAKVIGTPKVWINASAIGFYGDRGEELLTEDSQPGFGFLSQVCQEWERATQYAENRGVRVVHMRIGVVLSPHGGALAKMLTPFKLGLGGVVGSGTQYMSSIGIDDLVRVFSHVIDHQEIQGAVNAVTPHPVTNKTFTKALGKVLGRPTILPLPKFAARLMLGKELADTLILSSTRVFPEKLQNSGFQFSTPDIETALTSCLK